MQQAIILILVQDTTVILGMRVLPSPNTVCRNTSRLAFNVTARFLSKLWNSPVGPEEAKNILRQRAEGPHALYIHIPFCHEPLCLFCCFVRTVFRRKTYHNYMAALAVEIENLVSLAERARIGEVYIGGGTPTVSIQGLLELLDHVREVVGRVPVSVEAHPRDVDEEAARLLRRSGVARLSIGVQSFQEWKLRALGRLSHSVAEALASIKAARKYYRSLNIDLVWGLRGENRETVARDAATAFRLGVGQATFYPLMPPPPRAGQGPWIHPEEYMLYHSILATALGHGYRPATPWCMDRSMEMIDEYVVDYTSFLAAGISGVGKTGGYAYLNTFSIKDYAERVKIHGISIARLTPMTGVEEGLYELSVRLFGGGKPCPPSTHSKILVSVLGLLGLAAHNAKPLPLGERLFLAHCMQKGVYTAMNLLRRWGTQREPFLREPETSPKWGVVARRTK